MTTSNLHVALRRATDFLASADRLVDAPERFTRLTRGDLLGLAERYRFALKALTAEVTTSSAEPATDPAVVTAAAGAVAAAERQLAQVEAALAAGAAR